MWHTSEGDRTLSGAEAQLVRQLIAHVHAEIKRGIEIDQSYTSEVYLFDRLQPTQQLALLWEIGSALLEESRPMPALTAVREAAVYALFRSLYSLIEIEIDMGRLAGQSSYEIRSLAIAAIEYSLPLEELGPWRYEGMIPDLDCEDMDEWESLIESLADGILWDRDFEMEYLIVDENPAEADLTKEFLGIDADYYADIPPDPTADQLGSIHKQLHRLTASSAR